MGMREGTENGQSPWKLREVRSSLACLVTPLRPAAHTLGVSLIPSRHSCRISWEVSPGQEDLLMSWH